MHNKCITNQYWKITKYYTNPETVYKGSGQLLFETLNGSWVKTIVLGVIVFEAMKKKIITIIYDTVFLICSHAIQIISTNWFSRVSQKENLNQAHQWF